MEPDVSHSTDGAPIAFLLGLSAAGKSTLGGWVAEDMGFIWLEMDRVNGFEAEGLRAEWDVFCKTCQAENLASAVRARVLGACASGAIITFDSTTVFPASHLAALEQAGIQVLVLYGDRNDCLASFIDRERESGRGLPGGWWDVHNADAILHFGAPDYERYRMRAFHDGRHRERDELVAEVRHRVGSGHPTS